jgi:ribosomal protein L37AE/L43A
MPDRIDPSAISASTYETWAFDDIANPDRRSWDCPQCQYPNDLARGIIHCDRCDYQINQTKVRLAIAARRRRILRLSSDRHAAHPLGIGSIRL